MAVPPQAHPPRRGRAGGRRLAVLLLAVCLVVAGGLYALTRIGDAPQPVVRERCTVRQGDASYSLAPDKASYAALIAGVGVARGLPARATSIALATAIQESGLRNLDYGDRAGPDSRGLFQQRPSQGWGSEEQVMDPVYAANAFYDGLVQVPGYQDLPVTEAAQAVQRSAYPAAYADHEAEARAFASALTGHSPAALTCRLRAPETAGTPEAVAAAMSGAFGPVAGSVEGAQLVVPATGTYGWALAQWAVANAAALAVESVSFDGQTWTRTSGTWSAGADGDGRLAVSVYQGAPAQ